MPVAADLYYFAHNAEDHNSLPVILIHGAGGTHLSWPAEIRRLPGQRVLAVDLPGHGKSAGLGKQSIPEYARSILEFMDALKCYSAVLVGHSMGGAIALSLVLDHPERVVGLGLIGTNARLRVAQSILDGLAHNTSSSQAIQTIVDWSFGPQTSDSLKRLAARPLLETRPTVLLADMLACNNFDVIHRLAEIQKPALIVCGTEDKMTPLRFSEALAVHIPGAALQTIDMAGHMVMLEQPRRVAAILNIFLKSMDYIPGV
jgi:pimeloyl-ACP methyl ester carboxylesterase